MANVLAHEAPRTPQGAAGARAKRVFLTTAYEPESAFEAIVHSAGVDRIGRHARVDDPSSADIILFVENAHYRDDPYFRRLRKHDLVRRFREKTFMYNETYRPWCVLPGVYCSMPRRSFDRSRQRPFAYLYSVNPFIEEFATEHDPDLLFSFMGTRSHRARARFYDLVDPDAVIEDTSYFSLWRALPPDEDAGHKKRYAEILARSKFVLCPRGSGTSSYRLYEAMEAGRAPVVISDQWVAPEGPDWAAFMIRVPEAEIDGIPSMLREKEAEAAERGTIARQMWEEWFAPDVRFHRAVEACADILANRRVPERVAARLPTIEYYRVRGRRTASRLRASVRSLRSRTR